MLVNTHTFPAHCLFLSASCSLSFSLSRSLSPFALCLFLLPHAYEQPLWPCITPSESTLQSERLSVPDRLPLPTAQPRLCRLLLVLLSPSPLILLRPPRRLVSFLPATHSLKKSQSARLDCCWSLLRSTHAQPTPLPHSPSSPTPRRQNTRHSTLDIQLCPHKHPCVSVSSFARRWSSVTDPTRTPRTADP